MTTYLADTGGTRSYRDMDGSGRTAILLGTSATASPALVRVGFEAVSIPMLGRGLAQRLDPAAVLICEARARKAGW